MRGREVGGCDLSEAHAVGLLPDLCQPQPLLHLAVPGAEQGGQQGRGSLSPSRPAWSPGPTCGHLASCAARRGARAAASPASLEVLLPLVKLALNLVLQLIAHLWRVGWGLAAAPIGLACPPPQLLSSQ